MFVHVSNMATSPPLSNEERVGESSRGGGGHCAANDQQMQPGSPCCTPNINEAAWENYSNFDYYLDKQISPINTNEGENSNK